MSTTPTSPAQPTPDPAASQKVVELEKQLADAAQHMSKVQEQLSEARAADPNHPQVAVPYQGHAPVVMINGQQFPMGTGQTIDLKAMLGGMFGTAAAGGAGANVINIPPVVAVNGQVVSGGQPVDLSQIIGPEALEHVRSSLTQLGLGGSLGMLLGGASSPPPIGSPPPAGTMTPGPAAAMPYASTPGEVSGSGGKMLAIFAAVLVVVLIGVLVYLGISNS
jgi:hypothetical protein